MRTLSSVGSVFGSIVLGLIIGAMTAFIGVLAYSFIFTASAERYGAIVWLSFYGVPVGALVGSVIGFVAGISRALNKEETQNSDKKKQDP